MTNDPSKTALKFKFENIGPIKNADLELGDLTIIAGHNNTGKTYVTYALYGFLSTIGEQFISKWGKTFVQEHFHRTGHGTTIDITQELLNKKRFDWSIDRATFNKERSRLVAELAKDYSTNGIFRTFKASPPQFQNASFRVSRGNPILRSYSTYGSFGEEGVFIRLEQSGEMATAKLTERLEDHPLEFAPQHYERALVRSYLYFLLGGTFISVQNPFLLPSARNSISLFLHDLDFTKSQVAFSLRHSPDSSLAKSLLDLMGMEKSIGYDLPIHDSINFHRRILYLVEESEVDDTGPVENILGGKYRVINNSLRFTSLTQDEPAFDIPIHNASSSARELAALSFFLRDLNVDDERLIIIDEPESQLDTDNQIQLARLLVGLVNFGQKVLITTHSDYIVKEINNLIMLDSDFERKGEVSKRLGYEPEDKLSPNQVRAYIAEHGGLRQCKVRDTGVEMDIFDNTIKNINLTARELFMLIRNEREKQ